jgi:lipopolysaccharide/colanic/teichoic acid biosynthesis glycosyltransferase
MYPFFKRLVDIFGALFGLILFSPLFLMIALALKINSSGPVFAENQMRMGKGGKVFRMFKFRSMIQNAYDVLKSDPGMKKWYEEFKKSSFKISTDKDPRITKIGKWMRKTSLDELPQFINILLGEMSLVGPRAFHIDEIEDQQKRFPDSRQYVDKLLKVKPGLTGLWQVSGRSGVDFPERVKIEAEYAEKKSFWLDFKIILKTVPAVLKGEGN